MSFTKFTLAVGLAALWVVAVKPASASTYTFQTLDDPNGTKGTVPSGINDSGQIVGVYTDSSSVMHGFTYTAGTFSNFTVASSPGTNYLSYGINNAGDIVGTYGSTHGFVESGGVVTTIDAPNATAGTFARGINSSGVVCGYYASGGINTVFIDTGGTFKSPLLVGDNSYGFGINSAGVTAGYYTDEQNNRNTLLTYSTGTTQEAFEPVADKNQAFGINDELDFVGSYTDSNGVTHGYVFYNHVDGGTYGVIDAPGAISTQVMGINNLGDIVGTYTTSDNVVHGFLATTVPEPISAGLWTVGFMLVGRRRRR